MATCPGYEVLRRFCERNGFSQADVARAVGTQPPVVHDWFSENKRPGKVLQQALDRWSKGAVSEDLWTTDEERARVSKVEPFEADRKPPRRTA